VTVPPDGIASTAFNSTFRNTSRSSAALRGSAHRLQLERHVDERAARLRLVLPARPGDLDHLLEQGGDVDRLGLLLALARAKPRIRRTVSAPSSAAPWMTLRPWITAGSDVRRWSSSARPRMAASRLLKVVRDTSRHLPQGAQLGGLDRCSCAASSWA
jgi:hypothetical protein